MIFTLAEGQTVEFDPAGRDFSGLASKLAKLEMFKEIAKEVGSRSYFATFTELEMGADTSREFLEAYFSGGLAAVHRVVVQNNWFNEVDDAYWEDEKENFEGKIRDAVDALADEIVEAGEYEDVEAHEIVDEFVEVIEDALRQVVLEAMQEQDNSTIDDCVPTHARTELIFVPDMNVLSADDVSVDFVGNYLSPETVVPNLGFLRMLQFLNISAADYIATAKQRIEDIREAEKANYEAQIAAEIERRAARDAALAEEGLPPTDWSQRPLPVYEEHPDLDSDERWGQYWRAIEGVISGDTTEVGKLDLPYSYNRDQWNAMVRKMSMGVDRARPAALSMDRLREVMENCSGGVDVPCYVMKAKIADVLAGEFDGPVLASGGLIGLHDFMNGAGHIVRPDAPVLLDPAAGAWSPKIWSYSVDSVYGFTHTAMDATLEPTEHSALWPMVRDGVYRHESAEGLTAEIFAQRDADGEMEFWVSTYDLDMAPAGPFETPEVWPSLTEARKAAMQAFGREWADEETAEMRP